MFDPQLLSGLPLDYSSKHDYLGAIAIPHRTSEQAVFSAHRGRSVRRECRSVSGSRVAKQARSLIRAERRCPTVAREGRQLGKSSSNSNSTLWLLGPISLRNSAPTL